MSRYRKLCPRFWKDERVNRLSSHEKLIALYLFTGQSNRIGIFSFSPGEAIEDLGISLETFREGFMEPFGNVCRTLNLGWDETFRVLYLPTWWKYNCPENPNVLKACLADLHEVPQTPLIKEFSENLRYLPETFHQTFREGLGKPSPKPCPNQEQKQEQKQNNKIRAKAPVQFSRQPKEKKLTPRRGVPPDLQPAVSSIVARINELGGTQYHDDKPGALKTLLARLNAGATESQCLLVVEHQWQQWGHNPEMREHFNPVTLFREENFEKYLANAQRANGANGNGYAKPGVVKDLGNGLVEVDGLQMTRPTFERKYGRTAK